jgi:nucleoside-diphosphate-sugar epimerase
MRDLAATVLAVARSGGRVRTAASDDKDYLTDNPQRRCPDISKARTELGYEPKVALADGIERMLAFYRDEAKLAAYA